MAREHDVTTPTSTSSVPLAIDATFGRSANAVDGVLGRFGFVSGDDCLSPTGRSPVENSSPIPTRVQSAETD